MKEKMNEEKINYRPEIEGLRAFAVIAVIINHFSKDLLSSGYLGVDIFFVISGYVITSSLANRKSKNFGEFITGFFERRIKRIVPALIPFTIITGILVCFFNSNPAETLMTGITSLFGFSNFYLLKISTDYFAESTLLNSFTHTWSLDVEEQFYVIFPLLIWFSGFGKQTKNSCRNLFIISIFSITFSLFIYFFLYQVNQSAAYFLMPARFWEMAFGCITYLLRDKIFVLDSNSLKFNSFIVFVLLIGVLFLPDSASLWATFLCVLLTALLIYFLKKGDKLFDFFTNKFSVHIGKLSYSLYLWHWTILCISRWTIGITLWSTPAQIGLIYLFSLFSYKYVEIPFRYKKWSMRRLKSIFIGLTALLFSAISLGIFNKFNENIYLGKLNNIKDRNLFLPKECYEIKSNFEDFLLEKKCIIKSENQINFIAIGDSQTRHLMPLLEKLKNEYGTGLFFRTLVTFPSLLESRSTNKNSKELHKSRINYNNKLYDLFINNSKPGDILILSSRYELRWGNFIVPEKQKNLRFTFFDKNNKKLTKEDAFKEWKNKVHLIVKELNLKGINIVLFSSFPTFEKNRVNDTNPQWFNSIQSKNSISRQLLRENYFKIDSFFIDLSKNNSNVFYFDIFDLLCPDSDKECFQNRNYRDQWHLSAEGALFIYPKFIKFLESNDLLDPV